MMHKKKRLTLILGFIILIAFPSLSFAALTTFSDPAVFASQGTIVENYGFEDIILNENGYNYPGDPWTAHGVTYITGHNIIIGPTSERHPISNVLCYNGWTPLVATIDAASQFSMAGFDLGYLGSYSLLSMDIYTNLNTYSFTNLNVPSASNGFNFYGAITDNGEYFTGLRIASTGPGIAPAIDNVRLGNTGNPIPEPTTMSLLGLGLLGLLRRITKPRNAILIKSKKRGR